MKLFLGHLLAFAFMTAFCFIVLSGLALFIPLLGGVSGMESRPDSIRLLNDNVCRAWSIPYERACWGHVHDF